jgi:hypothetical protein
VISKKSNRKETRARKTLPGRAVVIRFGVLALAVTVLYNFWLLQTIPIDDENNSFHGPFLVSRRSSPPRAKPPIRTFDSSKSKSNSTMLASARRRIQYRNEAKVQNVIDHMKDNVGINFLALDFDQTILDIHTGGNWKGSLEELFPHIRPVYAQLIVAALTNGMEVAVVTFTHQTKFVRGVLNHIFSASLHGERNDVPRLDPATLEAIGVLGIGNVVDTSHRIPIRGNDRSWTYKGKGSTDGKQPYMASAVEELVARREEDYLRAKATGNSGGGTASGSGSSNNDPKTPPPNSSTKKAPSSPNNTDEALREPITRKTTLLLDDDGRNIKYALNNGVRAVWFNPKKPQRLLPDLSRLV